VIGQTQLISARHSAGFSQHFWGCKMLSKCEKKEKKKREYFITGFQNFPRKSPNLEKKSLCLDSDYIYFGSIF
jgi:hypothetical protein